LKREGEKLNLHTYFHGSSCQSAERFSWNEYFCWWWHHQKKNINLEWRLRYQQWKFDLNLVGMAVNDLGRAKAGKLKPDDTQRNLYSYQCRFLKCFGTPIINQPQVGILALEQSVKCRQWLKLLKETLLEFARKCFFISLWPQSSWWSIRR
jgi:2-oxoglutarate dehydrogenase E2 component (dihydrolipoamide succinyltransferase)